MRSYPCSVIGIRYEGRYQYILSHVQARDVLRLVPEPDNQYDDQAVAVYHKRTKIGYIPSDKRWVSKSLTEGDTHEVLAEELEYNDDDEPTALSITITVKSDGGIAPRPQPLKGKSVVARVPEPKPSRAGLGFGIYLILAVGSVWALSKVFSPSTFVAPASVPQAAKVTRPNQDSSGAPPALLAALGPAPAGKEKLVALKVIRDNFDAAVCPKVSKAERYEDGWIRATCSTGEEFRVFTLKGKGAALRCSALVKLGATGC